MLHNFKLLLRNSVKTKLLWLAVASIAGSSLPSLAVEDSAPTDVGTIDQASADRVHNRKRPYSPYVGRNFPTRPFFGDTHLHTSFSMDAGAFGCRINPLDAYRFARGEELTAS